LECHRLARPKDRNIKRPEELEKPLHLLEKIQRYFNSSKSDGKKVLLADLTLKDGRVAVD